MPVVTGCYPTQKQLHVGLSNSGFPNTSFLAIFSPPTDFLSFAILMLAAPFLRNINTTASPDYIEEGGGIKFRKIQEKRK